MYGVWKGVYSMDWPLATGYSQFKYGVWEGTYSLESLAIHSLTMGCGRGVFCMDWPLGMHVETV